MSGGYSMHDKTNSYKTVVGEKFTTWGIQALIGDNIVCSEGVN